MHSKLESIEKDLKEKNDLIIKIQDENGALKFKLKNCDKKHKDEVDSLKKQREDANKKIAMLEKRGGTFNKGATMQAKSRN